MNPQRPILLRINMVTKRNEAAGIDEYIAVFPPEVREILEKIRATTRKAAP